MKKKIRVCKWLVIGITSIGVIIMAVILTMYYSLNIALSLNTCAV